MTRKRDRFHRRTAPGAAPGTLVVDPLAPRPAIQVIAYGPQGQSEHVIQQVQEIRNYLGKWPVIWVNVDGLGDARILGELAEIFHIHRLAMEDVVNVHQRAKVEHYGSYYFIVARMAEMGATLQTEQLSLLLGTDYVVTFQELAGDCFDPVRARIRDQAGRIRNQGPDYLAYALLDSLIDNYFPVLEKYGEQIEALEDEVVLRPHSQFIPQIHGTKRDLLLLRRAVWPLREALGALSREPSPLIADETRIYLRDCYDHAVQIIDLLENYRDIASSLTEVYLSSVSNRMNEIMKLLTIFTTVFIPLNLIAGIYGMNFKHMPELEWYWGYPFALGLMGGIAAVTLLYFKRKGWL